MGDEFEWDEFKAAENFSKHGVGFESAKLAFDDPFAIEYQDDRFDYQEDRVVRLGMARNRLLAVVYAVRDEHIRIISARGARPNERRTYHEGTT